MLGRGHVSCGRGDEDARASCGRRSQYAPERQTAAARGPELEERREASIGGTCCEHVHPRRVPRVLCAREQLRLQQPIQRFGGLLDPVPSQGGELLAGHQGTRVPGKEHQKIQIARVPEHANTVKQIAGLILFQYHLDGW